MQSWFQGLVIVQGLATNRALIQVIQESLLFLLLKRLRFLGFFLIVDQILDGDLFDSFFVSVLHLGLFAALAVQFQPKLDLHLVDSHG